jgi:hypothetical protein
MAAAEGGGDHRQPEAGATCVAAAGGIGAAERSNACGRNSGENPGPGSATVNRTSSPALSTQLVAGGADEAALAAQRVLQPRQPRVGRPGLSARDVVVLVCGHRTGPWRGRPPGQHRHP